MMTHDQELIGFRKLYQMEPLYRAMIRSHSRCKPNVRMGAISRPALHVQRQRRVIGTVGSVYAMFGIQRSTRRT